MTGEELKDGLVEVSDGMMESLKARGLFWIFFFSTLISFAHYGPLALGVAMLTAYLHVKYKPEEEDDE